MNMININNITPLLKSGYVAMDKNGDWCWYEEEPHISDVGSYWTAKCACETFKDFGCLREVEPAEDWKQSLIKIY